jgi:phytoene synthase
MNSTALLNELPPPQRLALAYAPRPARSATLALLALDARLAAVLRRRGEPVLAQMRLAWWRDMLSTNKAEWPRGDAVLGLLGEWRDPAALVALVDGWEGLLAEGLEPQTIDAFAAGRGQAFVQLARELGVPSPGADACGAWWALGDLVANLANPAERAGVLAVAQGLAPCRNLPRALRALAVLAALGRRSLSRGGAPLLDSPGAALVAMRVGILGR